MKIECSSLCAFEIMNEESLRFRPESPAGRCLDPKGRSPLMRPGPPGGPWSGFHSRAESNRFYNAGPYPLLSARV